MGFARKEFLERLPLSTDIFQSSCNEKGRSFVISNFPNSVIRKAQFSKILRKQWSIDINLRKKIFFFLLSRFLFPINLNYSLISELGNNIFDNIDIKYDLFKILAITQFEITYREFHVWKIIISLLKLAIIVLNIFFIQNFDFTTNK